MLIKSGRKQVKNIAKALRFFTSESKSGYSVSKVGEGFSERTFLLRDGQKISPWHNIKLKPNSEKDVYTGYFELSFNDLRKMEVATEEEFNPTKQDTNKSRHTGEKQLRYYAKFPFFNYGMLPQTWEDSTHRDSVTHSFGDNDPLDIVELGTQPLPTGSVVDVKVLGAL